MVMFTSAMNPHMSNFMTPIIVENKSLDWALQRHQGHSQPIGISNQANVLACVADWRTQFWLAIGALWSLMNHIQHWFPYVSTPELVMELLQPLQLLSTTPEITNYTWELFKNPKTNNAFYYGELVHSFFYIQFVMARGLVTLPTVITQNRLAIFSQVRFWKRNHHVGYYVWK